MIDLFDSFIVSWIFVKIGLFNGSLLDGYRPLSKPTITHCQWTPKNKFQWTLQWRYNERDGVSNHRCSDCLFNVCFKRRSKKTSKLRLTGLCEGNLPVICGFRSHRISNAGNVSIWWRHHHKVGSEYLDVLWHAWISAFLFFFIKCFWKYRVQNRNGLLC